VTKAYHRDTALVLNKALIDAKKLTGNMSQCSTLTSAHRWLILRLHLEEFLPIPNWVCTHSVLGLQALAEVSLQGILLII